MTSASHAAPRCAVAVALGACLALGPPSFAGASRTSTVSAYCAHLLASKVSSIVGGTVTLTTAVVVKETLECQSRARSSP
jgi:hypothetical protein